MARLALLLALALVVVGLVALLLGPARKSVSRVGGLALAALVAGLLTAPAIGITIALWQGAHGIDVPWRQLAEDILALTVFRLLPVFLAFAIALPAWLGTASSDAAFMQRHAAAKGALIALSLTLAASVAYELLADRSSLAFFVPFIWVACLVASLFGGLLAMKFTDRRP